MDGQENDNLLIHLFGAKKWEGGMEVGGGALYGEEVLEFILGKNLIKRRDRDQAQGVWVRLGRGDHIPDIGAQVGGFRGGVSKEHQGVYYRS